MQKCYKKEGNDIACTVEPCRELQWTVVTLQHDLESRATVIGLQRKLGRVIPARTHGAILRETAVRVTHFSSPFRDSTLFGTKVLIVEASGKFLLWS